MRLDFHPTIHPSIYSIGMKPVFGCCSVSKLASSSFLWILQYSCTSFGLIRDVSMEMPPCRSRYSVCVCGALIQNQISTACAVGCMKYATLYYVCWCCTRYSALHVEVINARYFRDKLNAIKRPETLSLVMSHVTNTKKRKKNIYVNTIVIISKWKCRIDTCMINSSQKKYWCEKLLSKACR